MPREGRVNEESGRLAWRLASLATDGIMPQSLNSTAVYWRMLVRLSAWIAGIGIAVLMLPTVVDVTHRKIFGPSLPGMLEISEVGLVFVAYLAMASALASGTHISTPVLTSLLPNRIASTLRLAGKLIVWFVLVMMTLGSGLIAFESFLVGEFRFGLIQMPIWPAKVAVAIGLLMMLIEISIQIWAALLGSADSNGANVP